MSEESVDQLIESLEEHKTDTENNYTSEEAKAEKDQLAKEGINAQQAPKDEKNGSRKTQRPRRVRMNKNQ
jgi:hypothetical protein